MSKKKSIVVENGKPDSSGDIILPSAFKNLPKKIWVTKDFDISHPIAKADVYFDEKENVVKADIEVTDKRLQAAPGYQIIKSEPNEHGGRTITEAKLYEVSLIPKP
jgi:uncharacterized protein YifN (PemK superfamily)